MAAGFNLRSHLIEFLFIIAVYVPYVIAFQPLLAAHAPSPSPSALILNATLSSVTTGMFTAFTLAATVTPPPTLHWLGNFLGMHGGTRR
ncbi:hypothetical protein B0H11DRAFT_2221405 [Mycena galericulata]|nr:hypothetical protein B0H11DRAFT_2221405 [Mycena galericulata]